MGGPVGLQKYYQPWALDATVAAKVADYAGVPLSVSPLVLEGGGIEVDGHGALQASPVALPANRNQHTFDPRFGWSGLFAPHLVR